MGAVTGELATGGAVVGEAGHQGTCCGKLKDIVGNLGNHGC